MGLPGIRHKNIMPVIVRRLFLGCVVVTLGAVALLGQYREPAPVGPVELRVRQLVLSNQPIETRFEGLLEYFSSGFVRHATPGYSRVQYGGMHSRNTSPATRKSRNQVRVPALLVGFAVSTEELTFQDQSRSSTHVGA
jgi:hypothetical protein